MEIPFQYNFGYNGLPERALAAALGGRCEKRDNTRVWRLLATKPGKVWTGVDKCEQQYTENCDIVYPVRNEPPGERMTALRFFDGNRR